MKQRIWTALAVALIAMAAATTPASADTVTIVHRPPSSARANTPLKLTAAAVSSCLPLGGRPTARCTTIDLSLNYVRNDGEVVSISGDGTMTSNAGALTFVIPATEVVPPAISYWFVWRQDYCTGNFLGETCGEYAGRSPAGNGVYTVPVNT